jgi:hypothetical protein
MTTENFFIHNCCHRKAVKTIRKCFPELDIIPPLACKQLLLTYIIYIWIILFTRITT